MIVIFHVDDYRVVYYTIIMAVYFTDIIYRHMQGGCQNANAILKILQIETFQ
jgi:hypothetical protein